MAAIMKYLKSIIRGDFLTLIKADKNIPFILYVFFLIIAYITINLLIEKTMTVHRSNAEVIEELRIDYTQKSTRLISIDTRNNIEEMLEDNGSELKKPQQAPREIE